MGESQSKDLTCSWRSDLLLHLPLESRSQGAVPVNVAQPPWCRSTPLNLSKTCASAAQRAACLVREAQATNVLATRKSRLVCVCSFFGEGVCKVVSPFAQVGSAPTLHIAFCRMAHDLDRPDLVVGKQKPVPDLCAVASGSQGFVLWPIDCRDGAFAVDVQRERIQGELPCHGRCVVFAISGGLPRQNVARDCPIRCRFEVSRIVDRHQEPSP